MASLLSAAQAPKKFRAGSSAKAILAREIDYRGPGTITDSEGYEVTAESAILLDCYEYKLSSS